jgi:membrane fusion protein (multidrug efflux system)
LPEQAEYEKKQNNEPIVEDEAPEKKSRRRFIVIAVITLLVIGAGLFYWHSTFTEDTDDAQVDGDLFQVSSRITGQVIKVYVEDNQQVKIGDPIAEIDPRDYQVALEQAMANLASAQASAIQQNVNVPITSVSANTSVSTTSSDVEGATAAIAQAQKQAQAAQARVDQAKANAIKSDLDVERYTPLVQKDVISKQQYDGAVAQAAGNRAAVLEAEAQVIAQQAAVTQAIQKLSQARSQASESVKNGPSQVKAQEAKANSALADVKQAQAKVDQARLNLGYTHITAPSTGIVNKKNVQVGTNVSIGQDLLTIIPLTNLWVTANFKETQLQRMHPGQHVTIKVDALNGRKFEGKVTQIGGATGSRLSLFPPENATGNYVKVVQRIPVRIDFTNIDKDNGDFALRPGFSVTPEVEVK